MRSSCEDQSPGLISRPLPALTDVHWDQHYASWIDLKQETLGSDTDMHQVARYLRRWYSGLFWKLTSIGGLDWPGRVNPDYVVGDREVIVGTPRLAQHVQVIDCRIILRPIEEPGHRR